MKHILSSDQFTKKELEKILARTEVMEEQCKKNKVEKILQDKIVACVFFEPSTRTRLSFETAALKLGARIISAENAMENSSAFKGESIQDTTRMLCFYADIVVMRHPISGILARASEIATKPIINAGDGGNQHPTQGLLDVYTIKKEHGRLNNLSIAFGGDLLNSRTVRSLFPFLKFYAGNVFYFISPKELALPRDFIQELKKNKVKFKELNNLKEVLLLVDVLYLTRVQKERFASNAEYEKVKDLFIFKKEYLKNMKKNAIIMHALPKINEIEEEVDSNPRVAYFRQAQNGIYVRMAILCHVLGL